MLNAVNITNLTGLKGGTVLATTSVLNAAASRSFIALLIIEETVLSAITSNLTLDSSLVGKVLPVGLVVYGRFTSLTLTSGTLIAYND